MSFRLLKQEIIDPGLCQGCGLCAGLCKHLELHELKPQLVDYCVMEKDGLECGKCYNSCPQVKQKVIKNVQVPLEILALQTKDEKIKENAASGGFVTTFNRYLLEKEIVTKIIEVKDEDGVPKTESTTDPKEVPNYAGISYGRSAVLQKLMDTIGEQKEKIAIVGVPCEISGAKQVEEHNHADILKIGLFCNANIRTGEIDEKGNVFAPCRRNCPANVDASGYIRKIREEKFQEAIDLIRENNPFPSVCGRICTHECEYNCTLLGTSHPIAVRELKKFVTDWEMKQESKNWSKIKPDPNSKKVAIIGGGPSGLTSAYYLAKAGYRPTVFERGDKVGGMLRFGVPKFRLPDEVLDYDIEYIKNAGVEIKTNTSIGPGLTIEDLKKQGYEAFYISIGQYKPITLHLPGEDLPNVHTAIDFLLKRKYRYWENLDEFKGKTIGIIGGGPVAVDVAQTALRLGAKKVHLSEIRSEKDLEIVRNDIPPHEFEFMEYHYDTSTAEIKKASEPGHELKMIAYKINLDTSNGQFKMEKIEGTDYTIPVDTVIMAIGQSVDYSLLDEALKPLKLEKQRGKILVDQLTLETNIPGIFAGGDIVVKGKNVAVAAIAHGREAARSIDRYLKGKDLRANRKDRSSMFFTGPLKAPKDVSIRAPIEVPTSDGGWMTFDEIDGVLTPEMAFNEANRCFSCNNFCVHCQDFAAQNADLTAGDIGSDKEFTTVVIWTKKGQKLVKKLIKEGRVIQGTVDPEAVNLAISEKMKREIIEHALTPRNKIKKFLELNGPHTLSQISREVGLPISQVRYHALRLAQTQFLQFELVNDEPLFSMAVPE